MRLLGGQTSPYVRVVRMMLIQKNLQDRVSFEVVATRTPDSPVHAYNATGKIPTLVVDDNTAIGEARLICQYLDTLHDAPPFMPVDLAPKALEREGFITGFLDGVAVFIREVRRPDGEFSEDIIEQEKARAHRCLNVFENDIALLGNGDDYLSCAALVAIWRLSYSIPIFSWRERYPAVTSWFDRCCEMDSFQRTAPQA